MGFFKKKKAVQEDPTILSPIKGKVVPLCDVSDEAFASGMCGEGVGIYPEVGELYMPFDGKIKMTFKTKHAIGIEDQTGNEFLIHVGVDTVEMNGEGFEIYVSADQKAKKGDKLLTFSIDEICKRGYDPVVMLINTNQRHVELLREKDEEIDALDKLINLK